MPVNPRSKSCVGDEMRRFQSGALHSGRNGKVVKDKKQALAIALSACGKSKYAESLQSLGYSERVAETVAEMLEYVQIDWGRQFDTGKTAGGVTPPGNIKAPSPSLPGMDIDSRPGIQSGGQGKKKEDSETITAAVMPAQNPQSSTKTRQLTGLAMFDESGSLVGQCNQKEKRQRRVEQQTPAQKIAAEERGQALRNRDLVPEATRQAAGQKAALTRKRCASGSQPQQNFNEYDFTRCERPDGTFYGTSGRCRKGTEAGPAPKKKTQGTYLGGGKEGKVYDIDRDRVLKIGLYEGEGAQAHALAAKEGLAPRLMKAGTMKDGRGYQVMERVKTSDIEGLPHPGTKNQAGKAIEDLSDSQLRKEKLAYLATLKLNQKGVSHEDIHGGNLKWDDEKNRPVLLDFDNAKLNAKAARREGAGTLNTIGIRLENAGYYDEADKFYRLSSRLFKATDKTGDRVFEQARALIDNEFPG